MFKISTSKALLYSLFILVSFSCTDLLSDEDTPINISDEFEIDMFQTLDQNDFELVLELSSSEVFDCTNYIISTRETSNNNILEIVLNDILEPEVCVEGTGAASTQIKFQEEGIDQKIRFLFTDEIFDEADLAMNNSVIDLDIRSNNGVKFFIKQLTKIPLRTATCLFEYNDPSEETIVQEKIDALIELLPPSELFDGYYGHFEVEEKQFKAKDSNFVFSQGAHFNLSNLREDEIENFEDQIIEIQESVNQNDLKIEVIRTY